MVIVLTSSHDEDYRSDRVDKKGMWQTTCLPYSCAFDFAIHDAYWRFGNFFRINTHGLSHNMNIRNWVLSFASSAFSPFVAKVSRRSPASPSMTCRQILGKESQRPRAEYHALPGLPCKLTSACISASQMQDCGAVRQPLLLPGYNDHIHQPRNSPLLSPPI